MTAKEIITTWIAKAHKMKAVPHLRYFFIARDILEGEIHCPRDKAHEAYQWIRDNTKPSDQKDVLIQALEKAL